MLCCACDATCEWYALYMVDMKVCYVCMYVVYATFVCCTYVRCVYARVCYVCYALYVCSVRMWCGRVNYL